MHRKTDRYVHIHVERSLPFPRASSMRRKPPGSTISVPPYVTLFPVFAAHSSKFPYSTYPAPPTIKTTPSAKTILFGLPVAPPPTPPVVPKPALPCRGARGSRKI